jgi:hypothetical protein
MKQILTVKTCVFSLFLMTDRNGIFIDFCINGSEKKQR